MIVVTIVVAVPILPAIVRAFPDQPNIAKLVPLVAVLPTLALALTSLAAGALDGMVGRRRLLILGTALFAVSAILPIWLTSFMLILVSRAVSGLALGVMIPSAVALTGDYYSGAKLQRWLGAQSGVSAVVGVLAAATSGALGELNWRYAFLPLIAGAPLLVGLVAVRAPGTQPTHAGRRRRPARAENRPGRPGSASSDWPSSARRSSTRRASSLAPCCMRRRWDRPCSPAWGSR